MLVMLKELANGEIRDTTINAREVISVQETTPGNDWCTVKMTDGKEINVKGSVQEISRRLSAKKALLKG